jgi:hypothetical protein
MVTTCKAVQKHSHHLAKPEQGVTDFVKAVGDELRNQNGAAKEQNGTVKEQVAIPSKTLTNKVELALQKGSQIISNAELDNFKPTPTPQGNGQAAQLKDEPNGPTKATSNDAPQKPAVESNKSNSASMQDSNKQTEQDANLDKIYNQVKALSAKEKYTARKSGQTISNAELGAIAPSATPKVNNITFQSKDNEDLTKGPNKVGSSQGKSR